MILSYCNVVTIIAMTIIINVDEISMTLYVNLLLYVTGKYIVPFIIFIPDTRV